jgi:hypothetical protein
MLALAHPERNLTTACTRPRVSLNVNESLDGFEVECAAGDAWRWALHAS